MLCSINKTKNYFPLIRIKNTITMYLSSKSKILLKKLQPTNKYEVFGKDQDVEANSYFNLAENGKLFSLP